MLFWVIVCMKKHVWKTYLLWILIAEAVGALSGWLTRSGAEFYTRTAVRPPLSPPAAVFPVVWVILFALMGVGAARIARAPVSRARTESLRIFLLQLGFNFFWSIFFFNCRNFGFSFVWLLVLWMLILWMIRSFHRLDRPAAWLQLPYLLWVAFAGYLNLGVWILN